MKETSPDPTYISLEWVRNLDSKAREQVEEVLRKEGWKLDPISRVYRPYRRDPP